MRGAIAAAAVIICSCASSGGPPPSGEAHDDPVLDRYRSENFLDADRYGTPGIEGGMRRSIPPAGAQPTTDAHLRIDAGRLSLAARSRRRDGAVWEAYHAAWFPSRFVRIVGGDFVPDIGVGLVSSSRRFAGVFTPSWPLAGSGVKRWTGFYDTFIRGGAVTLGSGTASTSLLAGIAGDHATGGTRAGGGAITGLRASAAWTDAAAGIFLLRGDGGSDATAACLECAARVGPASVAAELTLAGGRSGAAWGGALRSRTIRAAVLLYHAPFGSTGPFSHLPGATRRRTASRSGASAALRFRLPRRCILEASLERTRWHDGYEGGRGSDARLRLELRRRAGTVSLALREDCGSEIDLLPVPPHRGEARERLRSAELSGLLRAGAGGLIRGRIRIVSEDRSSGWLASVGVRIEPRRGYARIETGGTLCRSTRGRTTFRFYEPTIPGIYSWKTVSGNTTRYYIVIFMRIRGLSASASLWRQDRAGSGGEAGIGLKY